MAHHSQTPGTNSFRLNNHSGHIESGQPWSNSTPTMSNQALSQSANSRPATPADLYATYTAPRANLGWQPHAAMTHFYQTPPTQHPNLSAEELRELRDDPEADSHDSDEALAPASLFPRSSAVQNQIASAHPEVQPHPVYTRIPLTADEITAVKKDKQALIDLIFSRYGPPDFPGETYDYERTGVERKYDEQHSGSWRFRVQQNGVEAPESTTHFKDRMKLKIKAEAKVRKAEEIRRKQEGAKEVADSLKQAADKSKTAKRKNKHDAKLEKKKAKTEGTRDTDGNSGDDDVTSWDKGNMELLFNWMLDPEECEKRTSSLRESWPTLVNKIFKGRHTKESIRSMWNRHLGKWKAVRNADNHTGGGDGDLLTEKQRKANEEYRRTWIFEKFEGALGQRPDVEKVLDLQSTNPESDDSDHNGEDEGSDPSGSKRKKKRKLGKEAARRAVEEQKNELASREVEATEKLSNGFLGYVNHMKEHEKHELRQSVIKQYLNSDDVDDRMKGKKMRDNYAKSIGLDF